MASKEAVNRRRLQSLVFCGLAAQACLWAAEPLPEFTADRILRGDKPARMLVPGVHMSIYGQHLAPAGRTCSGRADQERRETPNPRRPDQRFVDTAIYPTEICGVQVLIGDKPAGLLYVSEKQINFKIPQDSAEGGSVDLRVVRMGESSAPVRMPAGFEKPVISLEQPAYAGMPVWLKADLPFESGTIQYPYAYGRADFGCNEVEVRREGKDLTALPESDWMRRGGVLSGAICGSSGATAGLNAGRLPLHLLYRFDKPGIYEVRLNIWDFPVELTPKRVLRARSEWTPVEILPARPSQRVELLRRLRESPPWDTPSALTDALPSLLGWPDDASFEILAGYLYHPDQAVRRYAMNGLSYWPEDAASTRLMALLRTKGPTDSLIQFLTRQPEFRAAHSSEIVQASLPFLASESQVVLGGAVAALWVAAREDAAVREALLKSAEHVVALADAQTGSVLASAISSTLDERSHAILRGLLEKGYKQVAYALVRFKNPADLPALSALLVDPGGGTMAEQILEAFGSAALPYFRKALIGGPGRFTAQNLARKLMASGDPSGFQFAARSIEQKDISRFDMVLAMKSLFPELSGASDDAIAAFARARAGAAQ